MSNLSVVSSEPMPAPPYPADTRAGNYGLRLDVGRIRQSTTFMLADRPESPPELRAWLVFLWTLAWEQIPIATLPDNDELIAAILRMPKAYLDLHRGTLMRGWKRHSDGRLYHDFLTGLVLSMLRERSRFKRHRDQTAPLQPAENKARNVAPLLPLRAEVEVKVEGKDKHTYVEGESEGKTRQAALLPDPQIANKRAAAKALKGTRLEPDAPLPEPWRDWACEVAGITPQRAVQIWVEFRNYWSDLSGDRGIKLRWFQTWQNNILKRMEQGRL
jgi:hypothetical protein